MPKSDPVVLKIAESLETWGGAVSPQSIKIAKKTGNVKCALCGALLYADEIKIAFKRLPALGKALYACRDRGICERRVEERKSKKNRGKGKRAKEVAELKDLVILK